MNLLDKLERKVGWLAFPHLLAVLLIGQVMVYVLTITGQLQLEQLLLSGYYVRLGEVWRMATFMITPMASSSLWLLVGLYVTWLIGGALEREWGEFRFSLFIGLGWFSTVLVSFFFPMIYISNQFVLGMLTLAFARLFPDFEFLMFFVIPMKVKYLGWIIWAGYALVLVTGEPQMQAIVAASCVPYVLFFGKDLIHGVQAQKRRQNFRREAKVTKLAVRHTCSKCGATDESDPDRTFRYGKGDVCVCDVCLNKGESL